MRGEKASHPDSYCAGYGSPPRARGKEHGHVLRYISVGITPACAGKRPIRRTRRIVAWDHPRVRGEKGKVTGVGSTRQGSPPRARGKELNRFFHIQRTGITPACAGKSRPIRNGSCQVRDHPRVRGEKLRRTSAFISGLGSPPRARGKGSTYDRTSLGAGITPACAGKSTYLRGVDIVPGDHPRVCGEKSIRFISALRFSGSPPRVRGKVTSRAHPVPALGITPACAGKS